MQDYKHMEAGEILHDFKIWLETEIIEAGNKKEEAEILVRGKFVYKTNNSGHDWRDVHDYMEQRYHWMTRELHLKEIKIKLEEIINTNG